MEQVNHRLDAGDGSGLYADPDFRAVRVKRTTSQAISTGLGITTVINFTSEDFDEWNLHDNVTNNSRITVDIDGSYHVDCWVGWEGGGGGNVRQVGFRRAGTPRAVLCLEPKLTIGVTHDQSLSGTFINILAGDYFEVFVRHDAGANLNITNAVFCLYRLHEA